MTPAQAVPIVIALAFCGIVGAVVGSRKGYPGWGFLAGALLGLLGVIIMACMRPSQAELVRRETARQQASARAAADIRREQGPS